MKSLLKKLSWSVPGILLLAVTLVPFVGNVFISKAPAVNRENRKLAPWPQELTFDFPKQFDQFYQDHLPGRQAIVAQYAKFRRDIFKVNEKVIFGEKGWLFYNSDGDGDTLADFAGTNLFSPKELSRFIEQGKCTLKKLQQKGARVLVMIAPNKSQVYSELMPTSYRREHAPEGRLEQVEAALRQHGFDVVSVKQDLMAAKAMGQIYFRTDTHWNSLGSFVGFKALMARVEKPEFAASILPNRNWVAAPAPCGDIYTTMLGLTEHCEDVDYRDQTEAFAWQDVKCVMERMGPKDVIRSCVREGSTSSKTVLLMGDSYLETLSPHFAGVYRKTFSFDRKANRADIQRVLAQENPQVIVVEAVERYLALLFEVGVCE